MLTTELVKRSPIRILERSTHGGAGKGNFGVFAGRKGVGKTACLVHLATDRLLQNRHVIHVSFSSDASHIIVWYEDIFRELARRYQLDGAMQVHDSIIQDRVITTFEHGAAHWARVEKTLRSLTENVGIVGDTVVVDGYTFGESDTGAFKAFRHCAAQLGLEVWFSATIADSLDSERTHEIPQILRPFTDELAVVIVLADRNPFIHLELIKDHNNPVQDCHLKLDPRILLIAEEP